jgi:hypothetical protein
LVKPGSPKAVFTLRPASAYGQLESDLGIPGIWMLAADRGTFDRAP